MDGSSSEEQSHSCRHKQDYNYKGSLHTKHKYTKREKIIKCKVPTIATTHRNCKPSFESFELVRKSLNRPPRSFLAWTTATRFSRRKKTSTTTSKSNTNHWWQSGYKIRSKFKRTHPRWIYGRPPLAPRSRR